MTPIQRREVLDDARAQALANQHGKHRQAFEKPSSPPGFWRVDMASTQEMKEDRAKAEENRRQEIQRRHREALRGGGRWIFRDE